MKKCIIKWPAVIVLIAASHLCLIAQTSNIETEKQQLRMAEETLLKKIMSYDKVYLEKHITNDYVSINADGATTTKAQLLSDPAAKDFFTGMKYKILDEKINVYNNVGIITGHSQFFKNDTLTDDLLFTTVWIKEGVQWLYAKAQGTYIKGFQPPADNTH